MIWKNRTNVSDVMAFELRRLVSDASGSNKISAEEFSEIWTAREGLFELLAIEEKYDLLLRNYVAFERSLFETAILIFYSLKLSGRNLSTISKWSISR
jgi:hypothetical protein